MRRLCLTLLAAGLFAPAALAAARPATDGTLAGSLINGDVTIVARGAVWGQVGNGTLTVIDRSPTDASTPRVSGYSSKDEGTVPGSFVYTGTNLHFQIGGGGKYRLEVHGTQIDFTAVGAGKARFAAWVGPAPGKLAVGDDDWQPVPYLPTWVSFPSIPPSTTTPVATTTTTTTGH